MKRMPSGQGSLLLKMREVIGPEGDLTKVHRFKGDFGLLSDKHEELFRVCSDGIVKLVERSFRLSQED